jgi:hypothetical protein
MLRNHLQIKCGRRHTRAAYMETFIPILSMPIGVRLICQPTRYVTGARWRRHKTVARSSRRITRGNGFLSVFSSRIVPMLRKRELYALPSLWTPILSAIKSHRPYRRCPSDRCCCMTSEGPWSPKRCGLISWRTRYRSGAWLVRQWQLEMTWQEDSANRGLKTERHQSRQADPCLIPP